MLSQFIAALVFGSALGFIGALLMIRYEKEQADDPAD